MFHSLIIRVKHPSQRRTKGSSNLYHTLQYVCLYVTEYKSGFTYYSPQDGPRNGTIRFIGKKSNIGGHYDSSTGQFNCPYSGIYVFFLHIRDRGVSPSSLTRCWIRKNGSINLYNYLSRIDYGRYESSTSLVLHLSQGDIVDLGECSIADTFGGWSTFSGFLLQAD